MKGLEPSTYSLGSKDAVVVSGDVAGVAESDAQRGTKTGTSDPPTDDAGRLRELADMVRGLSPSERKTLRMLLDEAG